jgi:hypothetical protein
MASGKDSTSRDSVVRGFSESKSGTTADIGIGTPAAAARRAIAAASPIVPATMRLAPADGAADVTALVFRSSPIMGSLQDVPVLRSLTANTALDQMRMCEDFFGF